MHAPKSITLRIYDSRYVERNKSIPDDARQPTRRRIRSNPSFNRPHRPSCPICQPADTAKAITFDNFWYLAVTHYGVQSWTNNTIIEFEHLRRAIRRYLSSEEKEDKVDAGQKAFHHIKRTLQTIKYKQDSEEDLEDTEHILVNTGVHSENFTQGERIEEVYQENKLKTARKKGTEEGPSGTTEEDNFQDTRINQ